MHSQQFKTTVASYLILKGTWGTHEAEANNLRDLFGKGNLGNSSTTKSSIYYDVLRDLDKKKLIKLVDNFGVIDLWATRQKADMPLLEMSELSNNVVLLNAEDGKFEFALPFEGQPFVGQ